MTPKNKRTVKKSKSSNLSSNFSEIEARYHFIDNLNIGIWLIDKDSNTSFVNTCMAEMLGYEPYEMIGKSLFSFMDKNAVVNAEKLVSRRKQGIRESHDFQFIKKDGTPAWTRLGTSPLFNENGDYTGALAGVQDISAAKNAEEALRKSDVKLRKIIAESLHGIVVTDEHGNIIEWNSAQEKITGMKRNDVLGNQLWEIQFKLAPDNIKTEQLRKKLKIGISRFLVDKAPWPGQIDEQKIQCANGVIKTVQTTSFRIKHESSVNVVTSIQDITKRIHAEESLECISRERTAILDSISDLISYFESPEMKVIWANNAVAKARGSALKYIVHYKCYDLWHPGQNKPCTFCPVRLTFQDGKPYEVETQTADGRFWIIKSSAVYDSSKRMIGVLEIMTDITEQKKAEQSLRESEERFRSIIDTSQEWIWAIDADARHTYCNPAVEKILGYNPTEIMGMDSLQLMHPEDAQKIRAIFPEFVSQKKGWTGLICRWRHKDGSYRYLESNSTPILGSNGELVGFWGADRDITERKRTEEERLRLEQQIQQTQKLESLGLLAGGIAHDFNNLMCGIFGFIDLALATTNDKNINNYLSSAIGAIDRARNLTAQLLTFAKGGAPIRETENLLPVIQEASKFALSGSNVSCNFQIAKNLWPCSFDKNQIAQVINNIVINAQQTMQSGGTVLISATNVSLKTNEKGTLHAGNYVRISIHDEGSGIPEDILPRVFDPFFSTKQNASGMGLSICHSIIKRHDGWIEAKSFPGNGTTFNLYLPASVDASEDLPIPKKDSIHRGSGRILIMDDEEIIRNSVSKLISIMGYSVECKSNGKDTLTFLNEEIDAGRSFTAIILDLTIPGGIGGKELAVEIKKMKLQIPLFVASGYSNDPVMANPKKYGFTDSICKPFTINEISNIFNRHLANT